MASNLQNNLWLSLAQAQTANMDAAAYNSANASQSGRVQISWGTAVWSSGTSWRPTPDTPEPSSTWIIEPQIQSQPVPVGGKVSTTWATPLPVAWTPTKSGVGSSVWSSAEKVKSFSSMPESATSIEPMNLLQIKKSIQSQNPQLSSLEATRQARAQMIDQQKQRELLADKPIAKTWIKPLDIELEKLRTEKAKAIEDQLKSYQLAQADFNKNKDYYTNFDSTNQKFNNILKDTQDVLIKTGQSQLEPAQIQAIALKNGVTPSDVSNPLNIYKGLQMTDEWKQVLWVQSRENEITDLQTANDRAKEDAKTNLERNTLLVQNQIDDANKELQRNIDWMTASWAWSGAAKSSGYSQWMENVKSDSAKIIWRLQDQINYLDETNATNLNRIQEDFTKNMGRMRASLSTDMNKLKFDTGLQLNWLETKYWKGSKELLNALDKITEEFWTKSMDSFNKYLTSVKNIQGLTMDNINMMDKMNTMNEAFKNKRYGELLSNNWAMISNMSLKDVANEIKAWKMDIWRYADMKNLMATWIVDSLSKIKTVTPEEVNTINSLLDNWSTPSQIIASLGGWMTQWNSNMTVSPGTTKNRPDRNKNPWNLKWDYGYWMDPDGFAIFPDEQTGFQYMVKDVTAKLTGQSKYSAKIKTFTDLIKIYAPALDWNDPNNYAAVVARSLGFDPETPVNQLSSYAPQIAAAMAKHEGFTWKISAWAAPTWEFTAFQKAWMDAFTKSLDLKDLTNVGMNKDQYNTYMTQKNAPETPNAQGYRLSDYTTRIRNMLPAGQADQPGEQAKIEKLAQQYITDWLTPEQAALKYVGFNIKDPKNIAKADSIRLAFQNMKTPPKGYEQKVSDLLNAWKEKEAMDFVNSGIDRDVKDLYGDKAILTQNFESSQGRTNRIVNLIERNKDKLGAFDGPFADLVKKFKNEPEYQELLTLLTMEQADIRKYFAGSAVTDTEMSALVNFIGWKTNMQPDNLITQLKTIRDDTKQNYKYQRQNYGLEEYSSSPTQAKQTSSSVTDKLKAYIQSLNQ